MARKALPPSLFGEKWWYRHVCAAGGVFNILLLMGANLVGFYFVHELIGSCDGIRFLFVACRVYSIGMFVVGCGLSCADLAGLFREEELRRGIQRRC
ncbi:hypothetical protein BGW80DRAFT_1347330 [Lactifluus volemus]|nr:hypothetical protein BGW80DRAFT_1347330 [Lactifluus volemus]